jgi:hypothetical protein
LTGFSTVKREGIELTTGFTAAVNAEMRVGSVSETVVVTGETPIVDVQNIKQQVVLTHDVIDTVPSGRTFQNLGVLIPGVVGGQVVGSTVTQDVGGQSGQNFMTLAIHGGRQTDQRIEIEGMSTSAWTRPDSSAVLFTDGNFQEYNINVAASSAESETGGVRVNLIPREGGNAFKGNLFANAGIPSWQANNLTDTLRQRGVLHPNRMKSLWSVNPNFGGPIRRDRLWFFGSFTYQRIDTYVANSYLNKDPSAWLFVPDLTKQAVDDQFARDASARLTFQATRRNKVTFYYSYNMACHCHFLVGPALAGSPSTSDGSVFLRIPNRIYQATWSSPVTNRVLFEAGASYILENQDFLPRPESVEGRITDPGFNIAYRAGVSNMKAYTPVYGGRGSISYVTGSHAFKAGFTLVMGEYEQTSRTLTNRQYTAFNGLPTSVIYFGTPVVAQNRVRPNLGLYGQDQWTVKRMTVNAGLRFDWFRADYPDQSAPPTQYVLVTRSFPGAVAVSWKDLSPRLGLAYDLVGNGKTALKFSASRYVQGEGSSRAQTINPINSNNTMARVWLDPNGDRIVQGDPFNPAANGELGPSLNLNFGRPVVAVRYDRDWAIGFQNRAYNWEFSTGIQQEIVPRVSVNAAYFRRIYGNFAVTENTALTAADFDPFCVTAPTDSRLPLSGQQICGMFDLKTSKLGQVSTLGTAASNYGEQFDHWNGVDLTVNARLPKALLQGGISTGKTMTDNCDIVRNFPQVSVLAAVGTPALPSYPAATSVQTTSTQFCRVETPFLTQLKLLGSYTLPFDIQIAGTMQSIPGQLITASSTYTSAQIAPSLGRPLSTATATVHLAAPGSIFGDRLNQVDLRFTKIFTMQGRRLQAMLDLYNAFNSNTILVYSNVYGATAGATAGAAWQRPQVIMPARVVKLGAQLTF